MSTYQRMPEWALCILVWATPVALEASPPAEAPAVVEQPGPHSPTPTATWIPERVRRPLRFLALVVGGLSVGGLVLLPALVLTRRSRAGKRKLLGRGILFRALLWGGATPLALIKAGDIGEWGWVLGGFVAMAGTVSGLHALLRWGLRYHADRYRRTCAG